MTSIAVLDVQRCRFMHVSIERLYDFIMEETDLTEAEQSHLIRCSECITWLDACVGEKLSLMMKSLEQIIVLRGLQGRNNL